MIFGIFGKFGIEIGGRNYFSEKHFDRNVFWSKTKIEILVEKNQKPTIFVPGKVPTGAAFQITVFIYEELYNIMNRVTIYAAPVKIFCDFFLYKLYISIYNGCRIF